MQVEDLDGNVLRIGSGPEKDKPLGVWRDADGTHWRHLGNGKYEGPGPSSQPQIWQIRRHWPTFRYLSLVCGHPG
jgi:hypothetical protein